MTRLRVKSLSTHRQTRPVQNALSSAENKKKPKTASKAGSFCRLRSLANHFPLISCATCKRRVLHVFSTSMQEKSFPSSRNLKFFKTETDEKFTSNCPRFIIRQLRARPKSGGVGGGGAEWEPEKRILSPYNYSMLCYAKQFASASSASVAPNMLDVVAINLSPASSAALA